MASDPAAAQGPESHPQTRLPTWRDVRGAVQALTLLGAPGRGRGIDSSALLYPVIGLALGGVWLTIDHLTRPTLGLVAASVAVVLVANAVTAGRPALGLARVLAAALAGRGRIGAIERLGRAPTPTVWIAVAVVVLAEIACLAALETSRPLGLAFAPLLGRWSMVVLAVGSRAARVDGRRIKFAPDVTFAEFGWASTTTFLIVFGAAEFLGVLLAVSAAVLTIGVRVGLHRWLDGITVTTLDALCELVQLLTIGLLVALQ